MSQKSLHLVIEGISCASCISRIEKATEQIDGVFEAKVNFATGKGVFLYDNDKVSPDQICQVIEELGYQIKDQKNKEKHEGHVESVNWFIYIALVISIAGATCLFAEMIAKLSGSSFLPGYEEFIIALIVQAIGGYTFYQGTYTGLKQKTANMDTLVALGTTVAFCYSAIVWLLGLNRYMYFETSVMIIALILIGRVLEDRAKTLATRSMKHLLHMQPKWATKLVNGQKENVSTEVIQSGDIIIVSAGEMIPIDGEVVKGESEVNEAMMTGESAPISKQSGDKVVGGSLNGSGSLEIQSAGSGSESLMGRIINLVEEAQMKKPPMQRFVDKVAAIFVPFVLGTSLFAFVAWLVYDGSFTNAIMAMISVLIIACPCALGLATPMVILVTLSRAAKKGLLIKDFGALENVRKLKSFVFDKTGTLTKGELKCIHEEGAAEEIAIAKSLASYSHHPLSQTIAKPGPEIEGVEETPGRGIQGKYKGKVYYLGSAIFLKEKQISVEEIDSDQIIVYFGSHEKNLGYFIFQDELRDGAQDVVSELHRQGIKTYIVSGDRESIVKKIADKLGIDKHKGGVRPEEKGDFVHRLQKPVGMIGDGVNDAVALAKADVAIAMGSSADVAMEAAQIGIMHGKISLLQDLWKLSGKGHKRVVQNLIFAFGYNVIAIPIAGFDLLNPIIAALAMALSSLSVIFNALRKY